MNSLTDISMDICYATLCGVTQQELEENFAEPINALAKREKLEREDLLAKIKYWYNGYYFEEVAVQSVFLQTGYLTIKEYNDPLYKLDFPNYEVKKSFYTAVTNRYSQLDKGLGASFATKLIHQLQTQQLDEFFETLSIFFANIPFEVTLKYEKYYQSLFYAIFKPG